MSCPLLFDNFKLKCDTYKQNSTESFTKTLKISSDGSLLLTASENNNIDIYSLDQNILDSYRYYQNDYVHPSLPPEAYTQFIKPSRNIFTGECIYDFDIFPLLTSSDVSSRCLIASCRDKPTQLYGIDEGNLICSYCTYNQMDELEPSLCVGFNLSGEKIFCGSNRNISVFDVTYPGKTGLNVSTSKTRRDVFGLKGLMSSIEFNPDRSGIFSIGTYSNSVGIFTELDLECVLELRDLDFGVSHLKWSPCGNMLWIGGRKHSDISCWDVRNTRAELGRIKRNCNSNQKMAFDIDPWGKFIATGTQDGDILIYDAKDFNLVTSSKCTTAPDTLTTSTSTSRPTTYDCINSVAFHPYSALLISTAGQRHFPMDNSYDSDSQSESESESGSVVMAADHNTAEISSSLSTAAVVSSSSSSLVAQEQGRLDDGDDEINHDQQSGESFDKNKRRRLDSNNSKDSPIPPPPPPPPRVISNSSIQLWDFGFTPISY